MKVLGVELGGGVDTSAYDFRDDLITTDLSILSFDLLTHWGFTETYLYHNGQRYELKLGSNTWTFKELRESHNLLKLVKSNILNN